MGARRTVDIYLKGAEEVRYRELIWGMVREPAAPRWGHQELVTRLVVQLYQHVHARRLGGVCASPIDVVLDAKQALVVQPDIVFVSNGRAGILRGQVWGAPDLVVEVSSPGTQRRDRVWKRRWYRRYGVREYWIVDSTARIVSVFGFQEDGTVRRAQFQGDSPIKSSVLPDLDFSPATVFDDKA